MRKEQDRVYGTDLEVSLTYILLSSIHYYIKQNWWRTKYWNTVRHMIQKYALYFFINNQIDVQT